MPFELQPVSPDFVAMVHGLDLSQELNAEIIEQIENAIWKFGVLIFHDQPLTEDQHLRFASRFGPLYSGIQMKVLRNIRNSNHEAVSDISNVDAKGAPVEPESQKAYMNIGNWFWHTDAVYEHRPFCYSILSAIRPTSWGGETQFADLRAAYAALDERTKILIKDRVATFYSQHVRNYLGMDDNEYLLHAYPPVKWPLVRTHARSGRKLLWVDSRITEISGMSVPEGRALAHELLEHACQRERTYTHHWSPNDVVMWDNRSTLHRGRRFDLHEPRAMRRVATIDASSSLGTGKFPGYAAMRSLCSAP